MEVLELMKGTDFWPDKEFWRGKILFFETSELKPSVDQVRHMLRNYGVQGVFERISAMIFGRARDYSPTEKAALDDIIRDVVSREFGMASLPIVTGMDFGHTDPQMILPLGVSAELDSDGRVFRLVEPWLT